jgi:hypothetical protein
VGAGQDREVLDTCEKEVVVTWLKEVESYRRVTCEKEVES